MCNACFVQVHINQCESHYPSQSLGNDPKQTWYQVGSSMSTVHITLNSGTTDSLKIINLITLLSNLHTTLTVWEHPSEVISSSISLDGLLLPDMHRSRRMHTNILCSIPLIPGSFLLDRLDWDLICKLLSITLDYGIDLYIRCNSPSDMLRVIFSFIWSHPLCNTVC